MSLKNGVFLCPPFLSCSARRPWHSNDSLASSAPHLAKVPFAVRKAGKGWNREDRTRFSAHERSSARCLAVHMCICLTLLNSCVGLSAYWKSCGYARLPGGCTVQCGRSMQEGVTAAVSRVVDLCGACHCACRNTTRTSWWTRTAAPVTSISFSVNMSGHFQGYSKMAGLPFRHQPVSPRSHSCGRHSASAERATFPLPAPVCKERIVSRGPRFCSDSLTPHIGLEAVVTKRLQFVGAGVNPEMVWGTRQGR